MFHQSSYLKANKVSIALPIHCWRTTAIRKSGYDCRGIAAI
jgi:hypothetical protein